MSLTQAQTNALHELANGEPIQIFATAVATKLIEGGYAREATLDPAPGAGKTAINLTSRGRGAVARSAAVADLPATSEGDDA